MYKRLALVFFLAFSYCALIAQTVNPSDYTYSIRVTTSSNKQANQTGFIMQNIKGIVTALHGVINAREITAVNGNGTVYTALSIAYVDIAKDIAVLNNGRIDSYGGIAPSTTQNFSANTRFKVLGHPQGIGLTAKTVSAGSPFIRSLASLIPPNAASAFSARNSPSPNINVLYLEGNLVPGHSGAPVLDGNNQVVGVVNGGILGGAAGISWAVPIGGINLKNRNQVNSQLNNLSASNTSQLFAYEFLEQPISTADKKYRVDYFEITDLQKVSKRFDISDYQNELIFVDKSIESYSLEGLENIAKNRVISYLKRYGDRVLFNILDRYWEQNTYDRILTFPNGTTMNTLQQWPTYEDAANKYAVDEYYDPYSVKVVNVEYDYRYSDYYKKYKGKITDATIELTFDAAICSPRRRGYFSEEELEEAKLNWTQFVVLSIEKRE